MSAGRSAEYIDQVLGAARQALIYVEGLSKADFLSDKRTQQAVILNLVIIGEVATRLLRDHSDFVTKHPQVPWRNMKGMRNRVAHGYFELNLDVVWDTVQTALPELVKQLTDVREGDK